MTNSFIDYLAQFEFLDASPEEAWELFCESNYARQIGIIDNYARDAFDAGAMTEVPNTHQYGMMYSSFNQWKNEQQ